MKITFTNTAYVHTRERLVLNKGRWNKRLALQVRVGIIEHPDGVVLIDAGYSPEAISAPGRSPMLRAYSWAFSPELLPDGDPIKALSQMGYTADDVKAIILTHFHVDHISALARFPNARLIACQQTFENVRTRSIWANIHRGIFPELLPNDMTVRLENVFDKPQVNGPLGLGLAYDIFEDNRILAIRLPGHAEGHFGLCFPQLERPMLYAADVQWVTAALTRGPIGYPGRLVAEDPHAQRESTAKIVGFARAGGDVLLCHTPEMTAYDRKPNT